MHGAIGFVTPPLFSHVPVPLLMPFPLSISILIPTVHIFLSISPHGLLILPQHVHLPLPPLLPRHRMLSTLVSLIPFQSQCPPQPFTLPNFRLRQLMHLMHLQSLPIPASTAL